MVGVVIPWELTYDIKISDFVFFESRLLNIYQYTTAILSKFLPTSNRSSEFYDRKFILTILELSVNEIVKCAL